MTSQEYSKQNQRPITQIIQLFEKKNWENSHLLKDIITNRCFSEIGTRRTRSGRKVTVPVTPTRNTRRNSQKRISEVNWHDRNFDKFFCKWWKLLQVYGRDISFTSECHWCVAARASWFIKRNDKVAICVFSMQINDC